MKLRVLGITLALFFASQASCVSLFSTNEGTEIKVVLESLSPDGRFVARYFTQSGAGWNEVLHCVNNQPASEAFDHHTGIFFMMAGSKVTELGWSPRLTVRYAKGGKVLQPSPDLMKLMPINFVEEGLQEF